MFHIERPESELSREERLYRILEAQIKFLDYLSRHKLIGRNEYANRLHKLTQLPGIDDKCAELVLAAVRDMNIKCPEFSAQTYRAPLQDFA